jgi:hypothetical protein
MNIGSPGAGGAQSTAEATVGATHVEPSTTAVPAIVDTRPPRLPDGARPRDPLVLLLIITSSSSRFGGVSLACGGDKIQLN